MAIFENGLTIFTVALVVFSILETGKIIEFSSVDSQEPDKEEHFVQHYRQRRAVLPSLVEYEVTVELNVTDIATVDYLRRLLSNGSFSPTLSSTANVTNIAITTVCSPSSGGYQCRCEDQYRWPCDQCISNANCDAITNNTCGCINTTNPDGQSCQPVALYNFTACSFPTITSPPPTPSVYEYIISIELNVTDVTVVNQLRTILSSISFPFYISSQTNITDVNITTVCSPSSTGFHCICEDQYRWSCDQCQTLGPCDNITDNTCGCINTIPPDGRYCQSVYQHNFTACPYTTMSPTPTSPGVIYEYILTIELNVSDATIINQLRTILSSISFPFYINSQTNITDVNITTVCSPSSTGFHCICEDQYRWSCDQCQTLGPCDNITDNTCGCINTIPPDGRYCQSVYQHNFTACPYTTMSPTPTSPGVIYEYILTIELNVSDATIINQLRTILSRIIYPFNISSQANITDVNITSVCNPNGTAYQCRCEEQFSWPCAMCYTYGTCDNLLNTTCGCINARPPNGVYCQAATDRSCPSPTNATITTTPTAITDSTVNTTDRTTTTPTATPETPVTNITAATPTNVTSQNTTATAGTSEANITAAPTPENTTEVSTANITAPTPENTTATTTANITATTTVPTSAPTPENTTATTTANITANTTFPTPAPPTSTTLMVNTTLSATTTTTAISSTTVDIATSTTPTALSVQMSVTLNYTYEKDLSNSSSPMYMNLASRIHSVLEDQYKGITGFIAVILTGFRQGSVITYYVVQTTEVNADQIASANQKIPQAMTSIAPVIGSVSVIYTGPDINFANTVYTGSSMTLTCGPPPEGVNIGQFSSGWTFDGFPINNGGRMEITIAKNMSNLTVNNVILADSGTYQCTLNGQQATFTQVIKVGDQIKQAPILQLQSQINFQCPVNSLPLTCCVQSPYTVQWFQGTTALNSGPPTTSGSYCITYNYKEQSCVASQQVIFTCMVDNPKGYQRTATVNIFSGAVQCTGSPYGNGQVGDTSVIACDPGQEGSKTAICLASSTWKLVSDTCIVTKIKELLIASQNLVVQQVPAFVANLSQTVQQNQTEITSSSTTISAIVGILNIIANVPTPVNETTMQNVLSTVNVIIGNDARQSWVILNANQSSNASSRLLGSLETISNGLTGEFTISTPLILLKRTMFNNSFSTDLNNSITIDITNTGVINTDITTIAFSSLNNVMPTRNSTNNFIATSNETVSDNAINANVVLVKLNATVHNVTLSYVKLNNSLTANPQCVFWNFTIFNNLGAWDNGGCQFVSDINNKVTCSCNHLTSFSILMATDIPASLREALDIITYVGVGISLASLVICLIIEGYVWKAITRNSTAFMRHVAIVNTALSLLIADICFIIGAAVAKNPLQDPGEDYTVPVGPCSAATFFMHFFYLALFFWMLVSGLLLFYRTVMVFSQMSKSAMLAIGFTLGYGCPLIIAVITVAVTAPGHGYIRKDYACWLNWSETKALLAMVIPALTIVFINILIIMVVLFKMLRRGVGDTAQRDEKHTLVVIARCVAILTPLFGLTWSLGVGTMVSSTNKGLHIAFAFFNSLQGFFILVFGTLFDSKIRSLLLRKSPTTSTGSGTVQTRSTSGGLSNFSGANLLNRLRGRRHVYHVSETANPSSSAGASESYVSFG